MIRLIQAMVSLPFDIFVSSMELTARSLRGTQSIPASQPAAAHFEFPAPVSIPARPNSAWGEFSPAMATPTWNNAHTVQPLRQQERQMYDYSGSNSDDLGG